MVSIDTFVSGGTIGTFISLSSIDASDIGRIPASLGREIQPAGKDELALAERRKAIFDHNPKNRRPIAMPIDTSKNR